METQVCARDAGRTCEAMEMSGQAIFADDRYG